MILLINYILLALEYEWKMHKEQYLLLFPQHKYKVYDFNVRTKAIYVDNYIIITLYYTHT